MNCESFSNEVLVACLVAVSFLLGNLNNYLKTQRKYQGTTKETVISRVCDFFSRFSKPQKPAPQYFVWWD